MAERPPLDAVVFDAGGTLVRIDFEWIVERLAGLGLATTPAALRRASLCIICINQYIDCNICINIIIQQVKSVT